MIHFISNVVICSLQFAYFILLFVRFFFCLLLLSSGYFLHNFWMSIYTLLETQLEQKVSIYCKVVKYYFRKTEKEGNMKKGRIDRQTDRQTGRTKNRQIDFHHILCGCRSVSAQITFITIVMQHGKFALGIFLLSCFYNQKHEFRICQLKYAPKKTLAGQLLLGFHSTQTNILGNEQAHSCMSKKRKMVKVYPCVTI